MDRTTQHNCDFVAPISACAPAAAPRRCYVARGVPKALTGALWPPLPPAALLLLLQVMREKAKVPTVGAAAAELAATSKGKKARDAAQRGLDAARGLWHSPASATERLTTVIESPAGPPSWLGARPPQVKTSELAGAIKADKQDLRLAELETLFS